MGQTGAAVKGLAVRLVAAVLVVAGSMLPLAAQETEAPQSYTLGNGLEVVLAPDHDVPLVAVSMNIRVGAMNEPAGRSGDREPSVRQQAGAGRTRANPRFW